MAIVMNALDKEQTMVIGGNHFSFKPNQIKVIYNNDIAKFLTGQRAEYGFVPLPDEFEDKAIQESEEGKAAILEARKQGIEAYCRKLREQIFNLKVSLQRDLDQKNFKVDARVFASNGDLDALEELAKYNIAGEDAEQKKIDRIKQLEEKINLNKR